MTSGVKLSFCKLIDAASYSNTRSLAFQNMCKVHPYTSCKGFLSRAWHATV